MPDALPPCGLYRTTRDLPDGPPANRLVYFHNHGQPGPGVYLPQGWKLNRAQWSERGSTLPDPGWAASLQPLPAEGFYRVREPFTCCENRCRQFPAELLVQLGYNAEASPILFVPEWTPAGFAIPETGTPLDRDRLGKLAPLQVASSQPPSGGAH